MDYKATIGVLAIAAALAASTSPAKPDASPPKCPILEQAGSCPFASVIECADAEFDLPDTPVLTEAQKDIIKSTASVLAEHGVIITTRFYNAMLEAHPELRNVFSDSAQKLGHQPQALASAIYAYACNIHDLSPILPVVERIAHKHASLHIVAHQYGVVGKHLIDALAAVLGDALTPTIADAWYNGYWALARVFIDRERQLYDAAVRSGGWEGFKDFVVVRRVKESEEITSFYLERADRGRVPRHRPGQYIAVSLDIPALSHRQARQYSLSDAANGQSYRISVKREDGQVPGCVSNVLHRSIAVGDIIGATSPFGDFYLADSNAQSPLVLISAGVGQTPLIAMLNSQKASGRRITYITIARSRAVLAFEEHIARLAAETEGLIYRIFVSDERGDLGRMKLEDVRADLHLADEATEYYVCGPSGFMTEKMSELEGMGVSRDKIHAELFAAGSPT